MSLLAHPFAVVGDGETEESGGDANGGWWTVGVKEMANEL
jgi:hypothetical protein